MIPSYTLRFALFSNSAHLYAHSSLWSSTLTLFFFSLWVLLFSSTLPLFFYLLWVLLFCPHSVLHSPLVLHFHPHSVFGTLHSLMTSTIWIPNPLHHTLHFKLFALHSAPLTFTLLISTLCHCILTDFALCSTRISVHSELCTSLYTLHFHLWTLSTLFISAFLSSSHLTSLNFST